MKSLFSGRLLSLNRMLFGLVTALSVLICNLDPDLSYGADPVDISPQVSVSYSTVATKYNPVTRVYTATHTVTLVNSSAYNITPPLHGVLVFNGLTGSVTVPGALGGFSVSPYQQYYFDLSTLPAGGVFAPGTSISFAVNIQRKSGTSYSSTVIKPYGAITAANQPPTANAGTDQTVDLNVGEYSRSVILSGSGTDPENGPLAYAWSGTPDPEDVQTPAVTLAAGTYTFTLIVTDDKGAQSQPSVVSVTVNPPPNQPPASNAGPNQNITLNVGETSRSVTLNGIGSDPENGPLTYAWNGTPTPSPANGATATVTLGVGIHTFTLAVTDDKGATSTATTTVTILASPNQTPSVSITAVPPVTLPASANLSATVTDDGQVQAQPTLTWTMASGPGTVSFGTPGVATTTAAFSVPGSYVLQLAAYDGELTGTATVSVTVNAPGNVAPVLNAIGAKNAVEGQLLSFTISGSDPDDDALTFTATGLPAGATFSGTTFAWVPGYDTAPGSFPVTFTVMDVNGASASEIVNIAVTNTNRPPTVYAPAVTDGAEGMPVQFTISGSDPDGDTVTLSAVNLPTGALLDAATGRFEWLTPSFTSAGTYEITIRATDSGGLIAEQKAAITIANRNQLPVITTTSLPAPKIDTPYTVRIDAYDPDPEGSIVGYAIIGSAPSGMTIAPDGALVWTPGIGQMGVSFSFTVRVTDNSGAMTESAPYSLSLLDTIKPMVSLNAPNKLNPGASYTVSASAGDNVGVVKLTVSIDGNESTCTDPTATCSVSGKVADAAAPDSRISVTAVATDGQGNSGSATAAIAVAMVPDTAAPTNVTLSAPPQAAAGSSIILSATAADSGSGLDRFEFSLSGSAAPFATAYPDRPAAGYLIPPGAAAGESISFTVTAYDAAGNSSVANASTTVADSGTLPPDVPPSITLNILKPEVLPGNLLPVSLQATDDRQVAAVELYLAYTKAATFVSAIDPARTVELLVPADAIPGSILHLEVRVVDSSGNIATATGQAMVVAPVSLTGVLTGAIFDDSTGLPLEGATATLSQTGKPDRQAQTDNRGRYSFECEQGEATILLSKAGYNRVERPRLAVVAGTGTRVADARLTPIPSSGAPVASALGGKVSSGFGVKEGGIGSALAAAGVTSPPPGSIDVTIPPGAIDGDAEAVVNQIGAQGLQGRRLPLGWSPAAAFSLTFTAPDLNLNQAAAFSVPNSFSLPPNTQVPVVFWDEPSTAWRTKGFATVSADGATLAGNLPSTGHYAVVLPDAGIPLPDSIEMEKPEGAVLQPAPAPVFSDSITATVSPEPRITFYKPGVKSDVGITVRSGEPLASGTVIWAVISEEYRFFSGERIVVEPYPQEIVLYGYGQNSANLLTADLQVSPGQPFNGLQLEQGVITVSAVIPPANAQLFEVVGPEGKDIFASSGEQVTFPAGAVSRFVPVSLMKYDPADTGLSLPSGFTLVGGVSLTAAGTSIARSLTLSIPKPAGYVTGNDLLVVMPVESAGSTRFALVGSAVDNGDRIISSLSVPGTGSARFPGILKDGRILVLQSAARLGYAGGTVTGTDNAAFSGALVSSDSLPLVSFSAKFGAYVSALQPAQFTLTALDTVAMNKGVTSGTTATGGFAPADISLKIEPPAVVAVTPAAGATAIALAEPVKLTLSEPVVAATVTMANIKVTSALGEMTGSVELSADDRTITYRHAEPYDSNTLYTVSVKNLVDRSGTAMAAEGFTSTFTSMNTLPPVPPPSGSVSASIPGDNGHTTITGTQGTAGLHDTVVIVNLATGARNPVLVDTNGGFSTSINASVNDLLQLEITGPSGAVTTVKLPRFRQNNPDGSVTQVAGPEGGWIDGPGGTAVEVPAGAFSEPAIVTLKVVPEADFPLQMTPEQREVFSFNGAIDLDLGGKTPAKYLNVAVPVRGGETADDQWVVTQVVDGPNGKQLISVDTARVLDGRIRTSSPPCPGVTGNGVYGFLKSSKSLGVSYGVLPSSDAMIAAFATQGQGAVPIPNPLGLPFGIMTMPNAPQTFCIPSLTGKVTITRNTVDIKIKPDQLRPAFEEITIKKAGENTVYSFKKDDLNYFFTVPGYMTDTVTINKTVAGMDTAVSVFTVMDTGTFGSIKIRIPFDQIPADVSGLSIFTGTAGSGISIPASNIYLQLPVGGGMSDLFDVSGQEGGVPYLLMYDMIPSAAGSGNLVLKAIRGAIDPTQAQIDAYNAAHPSTPITGAAVTDVSLLTSSTTASIPPQTIPLTSIQDGAVTYSFDGSLNDNFALEVKYEDGKTEYIIIPILRLELRDIANGNLIKTISVPAPPRNEPLNLGSVSNDTVAPTMNPLPVELQKNFNPTGDLLSFTFSESLDKSTLVLGINVIVKDAAGNTIAGELRISDNNTKLTFVPAAGLPFGQTFTVTFVDVKDMGRNRLVQSPVTINTAKPGMVKQLVADPNRDISVYDDGSGTSNIVAVTDYPSGIGDKIITYEVPADPLGAAKKGSALGGGYRKQLTVLHGITLKVRDTAPGCSTHIDSATKIFTGDVAIATAYTPMAMSFVTFYDVTDRAAPCVLGGKLLSVTPENVSSYDVNGTYKLLGLAKGVAALPNGSQNYMAYVASMYAGLFAVNVGDDIPEYNAYERKREPMYAGNYSDVIQVSNRLVALNRDLSQIEVLNADFTQVAVLPVQQFPWRLSYSGPVQYDRQKNGVRETLDLVLVTGRDGLQVVDLTDISKPQLVSTIPTPTQLRYADFDRKGVRALVASESDYYIIDLSSFSSIGVNSAGEDKRIVWKEHMTAAMGEILSIRTDPSRNIFYLGTSKGLYLYVIGKPVVYGRATYIDYPYNKAVGIDFANPKTKPIRGAQVLLNDVSGASPVYVASTNTDEDGYYAFYSAPVGKDLKVVAVSMTSDRHLQVVDNDNANNNHYLPYFDRAPVLRLASSGDTIQHDIKSEQQWDATTAPPGYKSNNRDSAPFAILDTIYEAEKLVRKGDPTLVFPQLFVEWSKQNRRGRIFNGDDEWKFYYDSNKIHLLGDIATDSDEYDKAVLLHEWFHYWQDHFSRSDSPGGGHSLGEKSDPRLAFDEGLATAFGAMLANNPDYVDSGVRGGVAANSLVLDMEANGSSGRGYYNEVSISQLMWDLFDNANDRNDVTQLDFSVIYKTARKQKDVAPWITVFSYMDLIRNDPATTTLIKNRIDSLFAGDTINLAASDSYEMSSDRLYTEIPIDGTEINGSTTIINDMPDGTEGNKLKERKFFKFTMPPGTTGKYIIRLMPVSSCAVGFEANYYGYKGEFYNLDPAKIDTNINYSFDAKPGDWVLALRTLSQFVDATGATKNKYGPHDFKISIKPR